ncbi:TPA: hypothetical protein DCF80_04095 [Candidatus Saccharibacteria bacterium]|nr:hypothetical protein [Candidatus Saccharibacteria bacterium]HRK41225.1 hypothetical protein [Candidatus Saccharibacteria bacterium]
MKKSDIALLILIVSVSLGVAYFVGQSLLGSRTQQPVPVEKTEAITSDVKEPDARVFNTDAINPSVPINIGNSTNQEPFGN